MPNKELTPGISLDGKPYILDVVEGIVQYEEGEVPEGEEYSFSISTEWPIGTPGGMGETKRVAPNSAGNAFTVGFDTSAYGFIRLPGRRVTVTPGSAPIDKPVFGFEDAPAGNADIHAGSFTKSTTGGTTSQTGIAHGLSSVPALIIFFTAGQTASGTVGAGKRNCVGFTDGTTSRAASWNSEDNAAVSSVGGRWSSKCISLVDNAGGSTVPEAAIANIGASTFDLNWTNNDTTADIIHFIAIGGAEIEATVVPWDSPTSTGNFSVTGAGHQPDAVIHLSTGLALDSSTNAAGLLRLGCMDASGNQWAISIACDDGEDPSSTARYQRTDKCLAHIGIPPPAITAEAAYVSMDADGFTINYTTAAVGSVNAASLCIKGLQIKAGSFSKKTSTGNEAAQTIGFATEAFLLASVGAAASSSLQDHAYFALGAASGTTEVEAMSWSDEDAQATTDTYGLDDTALAFEMHDLTDGSEDSTATCGDIDMETAGWLNWGAVSATAEQICYMSFASLAFDASRKYVYVLNGQRSTKCRVSANVITVEEQKDFGNAAQCGRPTKYGTSTAKWYVPLGDLTDAQTLDTISGSSTDTWSALTGIKSLGFTTAQQGGTAALVRGHTQNKVDVSTDGSTFGDDSDVGNKSETITSLIDTGATLLVATDSNLYEFDLSGMVRKLTRFNVMDKSDNYGAGLMSPSGSVVAFFNHRGAYFWDGNRLVQVGPDANPLNRAIANVTHEPFRGEHTEFVYGSDEWIWSAYRVTESGVTKTYIMAGQRQPSGVITWHTYDRFDGVARLVPIDGALDSNHRLWFIFPSGGTVGYYQLGPNGEPDSGRDSIGHGTASTTYQHYRPRWDFGYPNTRKMLRAIEVKTLNLDTTTPVQLKVLRDHGSAESVGAIITSDGVATRYWTSNNLCYDAMLMDELATTSGYDPTTSDPQIYSYRVWALVIPNNQKRVSFTIRTWGEYASGANQIYDPTEIRSNLYALKNSGSTYTLIDPDGASKTVAITGVNARAHRVINGREQFILDIQGLVWTNS